LTSRHKKEKMDKKKERGGRRKSGRFFYIYIYIRNIGEGEG
jgi:hypothetical protein